MTDKTPRRELLEEAADLIDGDRNKTYGTPTQNFTNIAELLSVRFAHLLRDGEKFQPGDVADIMILVKVARNIADSKRDNYVDIAGYAACGYEAGLPQEETESNPLQEAWDEAKESAKTMREPKPGTWSRTDGGHIHVQLKGGTPDSRMNAAQELSRVLQQHRQDRGWQ